MAANRGLSPVVCISLVVLALVGCVGSRGIVHVGQPQVHTRERLIPERQERIEWLRRELRGSETVELGFQGLRDLRRFTGVYNELRANVDPTEARVLRDENRNERLRLEAEKWRLAKQARDARLEYENSDPNAPAPTTSPVATNPIGVANNSAGVSTSGGGSSGGSGGGPNGDGGDGAASGASSSTFGSDPLPTSQTPFGRNYSSLPGTLDPKTAVETEAEVHPFDKFRDRLALRNAIEAEMRQSQFDDAHDTRGGTLYELTLDVTALPGDWSEEFVEIEVDIEAGEIEERRKSLESFYEDWVRELRREIAKKVFAIAEADADTTSELEWLERYVTTQMAPRAVSIRAVLGDYTSECATFTGADKATQTKAHAEKTRFETFRSTRDAEWLETDFDTRFANYATSLENARADFDRLRGSNERLELADLASAADRTLLQKIASVAVVDHYRAMFGALVVFPQEVGSFGRPPARKFACRQPSKDGCPCFKDFVEADGADVNGHYLVGAPEFARRLIRAERMSLQAYAVQPKELAQNISDVAAREEILNLVAAVQAMLPSAGVDASNQFQFLERTQERLHAVLRQPLLVGFSRGNDGRRFSLGWVIGPKFGIDNAESVFRHSVSRYDVSAAVAVPAWIESLKVTGRYHWLHARGGRAEGGELWGGKRMGVPLPQPDHLFDEVAKALLHESGLSVYFVDPANQRRPTPSNIEVLTAKLRAGQKQSLVLTGDEVWRNPQVFLGNQKADAVEIVSSMKGLVATFDPLLYPGIPPKDIAAAKGIEVPVLVTTSFGNSPKGMTVTILPGPNKPVAAGGAGAAKLVAGSASELVFEYRKPSAYHKVAARLTDPGGRHETIETSRWDPTGRVLTFTRPAGAWPEAATTPRVIQVELYQYDRADQTNGTKVSSRTPDRCAVFATERARGFQANGAANGLVAFDFDHKGALKDQAKRVFSIPEASRPAFEVAYPGLFKALQRGDVTLSIDQVTQRVPVGSEPSIGGNLRIAVDRGQLESFALRNHLIAAAGAARNARLRFAASDGVAGTNTTLVPLFVSANAVTMTFAMDGSTAKASVSNGVATLEVVRGMPLRDFYVDVNGAESDLRAHHGNAWKRQLVLRVAAAAIPLVYSSSSGATHRFTVDLTRSPLGDDALIAATSTAQPLRVASALGPVTAAAGQTIKFERRKVTLDTANQTRANPGPAKILLSVELPGSDVPSRFDNPKLKLSGHGAPQTFDGSAKRSSDGKKIELEFPIASGHAVWPPTGNNLSYAIALSLNGEQRETVTTTLQLITP